jgi:serine/threonine protein kinase
MNMNPISMQNSPWSQHLGAGDRYAIASILGQGGTGTVFLATDTYLNRKVAIKLLTEPLPNFTDVRQHFQREVELRAALDSKHIVKVMDFGTNPEGYPFYVMEYLQGRSLQNILQQGKLLPIKQAIDIARQICLALEALYQQEIGSSNPFGIGSQDLKPTHIFLMPTASGEQVKVLDSGLTQKIRNCCRNSHYTTLKSLLQGTCQYAAPEQLEPRGEINHRADIYSLGVILFEMFGGINPFGLGANSQLVSEESWILAHTEQTPLLLQSLLSSCQTSIELSKIVSKCLQKSPNDRYSSIQALREALEHVEVSDRMSPEQTQVERKSQTAIAFNASAALATAPIASIAIETAPTAIEPSKDPTFLPIMNPLPAEGTVESNEDTVIQFLSGPRFTDAHPTVALADHLAIALEPPMGATSGEFPDQLDRRVEPNPIIVESIQEDDVRENTIVQYPNSATHTPLDQTVTQYSDSAIHNPANQTVAQSIAPLSEQLLDRTVHQRGAGQSQQPMKLAIVQKNSIQDQIPHRNIFQDILWRTGSFTSRFIYIPGRFFHSIWTRIDFKQWQSRLHSPKQLPAARAAERQSSPNSNKQFNRPTADDAMAIEGQPSSEQHRKMLQELDYCRLAFAKELARNGKFRDAIAMANQISETSRFFRDSQTLIRSWKQF